MFKGDCAFPFPQVDARVPKAPIRVVSNIHVLEPTPLGFWQREGCVFTGNFNHLPNRDAVLFFAQEILPLIHPQVNGSWISEICALHANMYAMVLDGAGLRIPCDWCQPLPRGHC